MRERLSVGSIGSIGSIVNRQLTVITRLCALTRTGRLVMGFTVLRRATGLRKSLLMGYLSVQGLRLWPGGEDRDRIPTKTFYFSSSNSLKPSILHELLLISPLTVAR